MALSRDMLQKKKPIVEKALNKALADQFHNAGLSIVSIGPAKNDGGQLDFKIALSTQQYDAGQLSQGFQDNVVAFARSRVQEQVPGSEPVICFDSAPRAQMNNI